MTKERFEDLIGLFFSTYSTSNSDIRAAITAVHTFVRDEVIEECAVAAKSQNRRSNYDPVWLGVLESCKIIRALKSKETKL